MVVNRLRWVPYFFKSVPQGLGKFCSFQILCSKRRMHLFQSNKSRSFEISKLFHSYSYDYFFLFLLTLHFMLALILIRFLSTATFWGVALIRRCCLNWVWIGLVLIRRQYLYLRSDDYYRIGKYNYVASEIESSCMLNECMFLSCHVCVSK